MWAHQARLTDEGVDSLEETGTCCFAKQDKVWVDGPDGAWEIYAVLEDSDAFGAELGQGRRPDRRLAVLRVGPEAEARCC